MKEIWLGPLLNNNRALLIERCAKLVANNQSDAFIYLAASYPLLESVTQQILDGNRNRGVWGELPVHLFRGFIRRILYSAIDDDGNGIPPRIPIDREELPLKRSLISQVLLQLLAANKLKAFAPLAGREGVVNSVAILLGEIQRAAKTPAELIEILETRARDIEKGNHHPRGITQLDFDREVETIYSTYGDLLNQNQFTEEDMDQLRALWVLRGLIDGRGVRVPWLANVQLFIIDGFFDFTPVQGEILRQLLPRMPEVVVNLNHDDSNPEIFLPFQETIGQLESMATFDTVHMHDYTSPPGLLAQLRENLFNPLQPSIEGSEEPEFATKEIRYLECGDRDTEIRTIVREVKRLVLTENYSLADIALVVRERSRYANRIARVLHEESLPCNLELRVDAGDVPANRAALKLLLLLEGLTTDQDEPTTRISEIADLIKSEYFRLSDAELRILASRFEENHRDLLNPESQTRIGIWDADALENAFAYVGSDLTVSAWLARAHKLFTELPGATATKEVLNIDPGAQDRDTDIADNVENAEIVKLDERGVERKRRPARDIEPWAIAWTALVVRRFSELLYSLPHEGKLTDLRSELMRLLDRFGFREQISEPSRRSNDEAQLPQVMLNFNSLEIMRRAFVAAIKSIELAGNGAKSTRLSNFLQEVRRSLGSQSQLFGAPDRNGLRILEATDVRGLRFRAVFCAGLTEGGFPLTAGRDWIYPHEERDRLREYGLTLEDISPNTLLKEEHYFYQVACRATERLYLTRPLMLDDDTETVASYYIDELRRAVAPYRVETEIIRRDYDGKHLAEASNTNEMKISLVRQQERHLHRGQREGLLPQPRITRLLTLARNDGYLSDAALRRIEIERERCGPIYGPYDGIITNPDLLRLVRQKFGSDFVHSASGLSVYGNCPYRFFAQRVLRLEPRGEAALDLQAIDAGKLLHDILRRFFEKHRREPLHKLDRKKLQTELASIADKVFDEHERVVPPLNKQIWKIDREIRKILLDQVLLYELEVQEAAEREAMLPAYFEVAFGGMKSAAKDPNSKEEPLELQRETLIGEESIKISGQIDRVDVARDNTVVAYDYKLSTGSSRSDITSGRSLQLPIYLEALEKLILPDHPVAGGGYYVIRGAQDRRNKGLYRASQLDYLRLRARNSVFSDEEWQHIRGQVVAKIWEFLDRMRAGDFRVDPSERLKTCRFCDYRAVSRYDRDRIERKK
ncbi:MAG: PD-(D/E)XK nuclease family protein [Acidobacteria bacterium]|nr:PD-(D/E)XK nuclease family protein [Acidobacteriota bacterium]MCA1627482.1 PD-(D/E)XK nuclease family protein [Acidobacteriota bacterium]